MGGTGSPGSTSKSSAGSLFVGKQFTSLQASRFDPGKFMVVLPTAAAGLTVSGIVQVTAAG